MLGFGDALYRLTERDMLTSLMDPYFRALPTNALAIAGVTASSTLNIPVDRAFWLHSIIFSGGAEAATQWNAFTLGVVQAGVTVTTVVAKGLTSAAGAAYTETYQLELLIPPNASALSFNMSRAGTTGAVNVNFTAVGYLIPPGRINRL